MHSTVLPSQKSVEDALSYQITYIIIVFCHYEELLRVQLIVLDTA